MTGLGRRDRAIAAIIPAVLVVVALHQVGSALTRDLTPWKGGGFGMFATADHRDTRVPRTHFVTDARLVPLHGDALFELADAGHLDTIQTLRALPSRANARAWTAVLAGQAWRLQDGVAQLAGDGEGTRDGRGTTITLDAADGPVAVRAVRVEVWRTRYERATARILPELVAAYDLPLDEAPP